MIKENKVLNVYEKILNELSIGDVAYKGLSAASNISQSLSPNKLSDAKKLLGGNVQKLGDVLKVAQQLGSKKPQLEQIIKNSLTPEQQKQYNPNFLLHILNNINAKKQEYDKYTTQQAKLAPADKNFGPVASLFKTKESNQPGQDLLQTGQSANSMADVILSNKNTDALKQVIQGEFPSWQKQNTVNNLPTITPNSKRNDDLVLKASMQLASGNKNQKPLPSDVSKFQKILKDKDPASIQKLVGQSELQKNENFEIEGLKLMLEIISK